MESYKSEPSTHGTNLLSCPVQHHDHKLLRRIMSLQQAWRVDSPTRVLHSLWKRRFTLSRKLLIFWIIGVSGSGVLPPARIGAEDRRADREKGAVLVTAVFDATLPVAG